MFQNMFDLPQVKLEVLSSMQVSNNLTTKNSFLTIAVEKYANTDMKVYYSCLILLDFLNILFSVISATCYNFWCYSSFCPSAMLHCGLYEKWVKSKGWNIRVHGGNRDKTRIEVES